MSVGFAHINMYLLCQMSIYIDKVMLCIGQPLCETYSFLEATEQLFVHVFKSSIRLTI